MARRYPNRVYMDWAAPYETSREQRFPFGQVMELPNGAVYRYTRMGAALGVPGALYQSELPDSEFDTLAVQAAVAVGATAIPFTNGTTALTENEFAEGTITEELAAELGHIYPVKSHGSVANGATGTFTLADGVTVQSALTTTGTVTILKNPWLDVIIHPSVATAMVVGVPQVAIQIAYHGWVQTHGFANCLDDGACVIGKPVRVSETVDGSVTPMDMDEGSAVMNSGMVGVAMYGVTSLDYVGIWLTLE